MRNDPAKRGAHLFCEAWIKVTYNNAVSDETEKLVWRVDLRVRDICQTCILFIQEILLLDHLGLWRWSRILDALDATLRRTILLSVSSRR